MALFCGTLISTPAPDNACGGHLLAQDAPIPYIDRIREYYLALGYDTPYQWASFDTVPFSKLSKPLSQASICVVTTAAPFRPNKGDQRPGADYNAAAKFYSVYSAPTDDEPDLRISHIAIDRAHTTAHDQGSYFPLQSLRALVRDGTIGSISPRFHGLPTNRSHKTTTDIDCPELVARCLEDGADAAAGGAEPEVIGEKKEDAGGDS